MSAHVIPPLFGLATIFLASTSVVTAPDKRELIVSTAPQLVAAVRQARGGERIRLAPGLYPPVTLQNISPGRVVTLTSRDPADPAILTGLFLRNSGNLTLSGLTLRSAGSPVQHGFTLHRVHDVSLDQVRVTGRPGPIGRAQDKLLLVRDSRDVGITRSEFTNSFTAISLLDTHNATVTGNYLHHLRMDGVRGGGNSHIVIAENVITDFAPAPGDHPDAIQMWTSRQGSAASNITIRGNIIDRGAGAAMQGIFLRDEKSGLPYRDVVIADNIVIGAMYNGIAVLSKSPSLVVKDNVVARFPDQKSWIRVQEGARLTGNAAPLYLIGAAAPATPPSNTVMPVTGDRGRSALRRWISNRSMAGYHATWRQQAPGL